MGRLVDVDDNNPAVLVFSLLTPFFVGCDGEQ